MTLLSTLVFAGIIDHPHYHATITVEAKSFKITFT